MRIRTITYNVYDFKGWPEEVGVTPEEITQSFVKAIKKYQPDIITLSGPPFRVNPRAKRLWSLSDHLPVMATFKIKENFANE